MSDGACRFCYDHYDLFIHCETQVFLHVPGDMEPLVALGDVLCDLAETHETEAAALASNVAAAAATEQAGSHLAAASSAYQQAIDQGYLAALNISRTNADALVGVAEVNAGLARLAAAAGDAGGAAERWLQSRQAYNSALQKPQALGRFRERCDVRYNYACVCALSGQPELAQQLLASLAAAGALLSSELAQDEDLRSLHALPWFVELLQGLASAGR